MIIQVFYINLNTLNNLLSISDIQHIAKHLDFLIEKWHNLNEKNKAPLAHVAIQNYDKSPEGENNEIDSDSEDKVEENSKQNTIEKNVK